MEKVTHTSIPSLPKPTVLATKLPEPSQGTLGTAIGAELYHPGSALPSQQRGDGGADQAQARGWKTLIISLKGKVRAWQAQIRRYYLAHMRKHLTLTTKRTFRFVRLIAFIIRISRRMLFRKTTFRIILKLAHDRKYALFRRRAVESDNFSPCPPSIISIILLFGRDTDAIRYCDG